MRTVAISLLVASLSLVVACKKGQSLDSEQATTTIGVVATGICESGMLEPLTESLQYKLGKTVPFVRDAAAQLQEHVEADSDGEAHREFLKWAGDDGDRARKLAALIVSEAEAQCELSAGIVKSLRGLLLGFSLSYAAGQR